MTPTEPSSTSVQDLEKTFYSDLDRFKTLCFRLIERGQPYQVVVLCHELYRFLYPIEPYAEFTHTDPVPATVEHQRTLIELAHTLLSTVRGYSFDPASTRTAAARPLETQTSDLYSSLWAEFDRETLLVEARKLLERRLPAMLVDTHITGRRVLDMGCGSGRYSLALAALGAREVVAVDYQAKAYKSAEQHAAKAELPVAFQEADVLNLPFADGSFDFVFCNGVLHHTRDWKAGVREYARVMQTSGYLYLYACGGFYWTVRATLREVFARIPQAYTHEILRAIGLPSHRFIFMDTWYVPVEGHLKKAELDALMTELQLTFETVPSSSQFDPAYGLASGVPGAEIMWGEGEHRYLVVKKPAAHQKE